ncbi:MAG: hypothetical protein ACYTEQ_12660 [Planctomycetota bacterium]|jgi:hypothetical protein
MGEGIDKRFLLRIANQVDGNYRKNNARWRYYLSDFYKKLKVWQRKYDTAFKREQKGARHVKYPIHCPLDWLCLPDWMEQLHPEAGYKPEPAANDHERLSGCYVLLSVIHDKMLTGPRTERIHNGIWDDDEERVADVWKEITGTHTVGYCDVRNEVKNEIQNALELVTEDVGAGGWLPPPGHISTSEIVEKYRVPRTTLQGWQERDQIIPVRNPQTHENWYPEQWLHKKLKNYKRRGAKSKTGRNHK